MFFFVQLPAISGFDPKTGSYQVLLIRIMSNTLKPYLNCVRASLDAALCLRNFPSQTVERHNKVGFRIGAVAAALTVDYAHELILFSFFCASLLADRCLLAASPKSKWGAWGCLVEPPLLGRTLAS